MIVHGKKTYLCSTALALIGLAVLIFYPTATWSDPSPVSTIIGVLMLALAATTASTRHAIAKVEDRILRAFEEIAPESDSAGPL